MADKLALHKNNMKNTWKILNNILNKNHKSKFSTNLKTIITNTLQTQRYIKWF